MGVDVSCGELAEVTLEKVYGLPTSNARKESELLWEAFEVFVDGSDIEPEDVVLILLPGDELL
jgi:outer membrane protease